MPGKRQKLEHGHSKADVAALVDDNPGGLEFWQQMASVTYTVPFEIAQAVKFIAEIEGKNVSEVAADLLRTGCRNWGKR